MSEQLIPLRIADQAVAACNAEIAKLQEENASLKAEVYRLEEIVGSDAIDRKYGMCCDTSDEASRLKADVERLTEAGDTMANVLCFTLGLSGEEPKFVKDWNAAKGGDHP